MHIPNSCNFFQIKNGVYSCITSVNFAKFGINIKLFNRKCVTKPSF